MEAPKHIGIDLHRNRFTCCVRLDNGREYFSTWALEQLPRFVKKLGPPDQVAVEVTGNTRLFHDAVAPHVARVVVVDTNQFRVISRSVKKTEPRDAALLALYLGKGLLPEVRMKDKAHGQLASLTQTRDTLVKLRTSLKNKVNNLLSARGINLAREALSSEKKLEEVLAWPFDELVRFELRVIVDQIRSLNRSIGELEKRIAQEGRKLPGHKNLTSIKGIGPITGAILLSVIGEVNDFPDESRLASYFGIVLGTGLALDQSMQRVSEEMQYIYPKLANEFFTVVMQVKAGQERSVAFRQLVRRTGIEDIKSLAAMIVQSERFGTSLAQALKVYADALRTRRRLRAEAAVAKAGVKMLFPIVLFILPVLFVITLVPGLLSVLGNLQQIGGAR